MNPADPQGLLHLRQRLITLQGQVNALLEHPLLQEGAEPDMDQQGPMLESGHQVVSAAYSVEWTLHQLEVQMRPPEENTDEYVDLEWEIDRGPDEF